MAEQGGRARRRRRYGSTVVRGTIAAIGILAAIVGLDRRASARGANTSVANLTRAAAMRDAPDSATLARVLASARGANPLLCELAGAAVDGRNGWGPGWLGSAATGTEGELVRQLGKT